MTIYPHNVLDLLFILCQSANPIILCYIWMLSYVGYFVWGKPSPSSVPALRPSPHTAL